MGLNEEDRGMLEKIIDATIKVIPEMMVVARANKKRMLIDAEFDFVYGEAFGRCNGGFIMYYTITHDKPATPDERNEVWDIIEKRAQELREAVFKTG